MDLGRYINTLNTVLSDQQQKKRTFICSLSLLVCFLKVVHLWRFFHKFTFFQPVKFIPGGPFRLVGGGVRSHPSHPPPAYAPAWITLSCNRRIPETEFFTNIQKNLNVSHNKCLRLVNLSSSLRQKVQLFFLRSSRKRV